LKAKGTEREMMYYVLTGKGVPREGCPVLKNGAEIGLSTSAGYSPTLKNGIGIARVNRGTVCVGEEVEVVIRGRPVRAVAVERPFYQYHG
jgi:aminomethyltransferase